MVHTCPHATTREVAPCFFFEFAIYLVVANTEPAGAQKAFYRSLAAGRQVPCLEPVTGLNTMTFFDLFLVANLVTTSKALVATSDALVPSSFLLLPMFAAIFYIMLIMLITHVNHVNLHRDTDRRWIQKVLHAIELLEFELKASNLGIRDGLLLLVVRPGAPFVASLLLAPS